MDDFFHLLKMELTLTHWSDSDLGSLGAPVAPEVAGAADKCSARFVLVVA